MKKWVAITCAAVCVIVGGLWYADYRVKEAIGNQVASVLTDPSSQAEINNIVNSLGNSVNIGLAGAVGNELGAANTVGGAAGSTTGSAGQGNGNSAGTGSGASTNQSASGTGNGSGGSSGSATSSSSGAGSSGSGSNRLGQAGNTAGSQGAATPTFTSRQQVVNYAMSKFTTAQISKYAYEYAHRSSLTQAQKNQIKADILSHFTPAEIAAMRAAADKYK